MRITELRVRDFRALADSGTLTLRGLNVLLGPNNAGKSSLIRALLLMQHGLPSEGSDIRLGSDRALVSAQIDDPSSRIAKYGPSHPKELVAILSRASLNVHVRFDGKMQEIGQLPGVEPDHWIQPFLSSRKTDGYDQTVNTTTTTVVSPTLRHLPAKLARLANPAFPAHDTYCTACEETIGFVVTAIPAANGMQAGIYVEQGSIPLEAMGEGVANIVGLIADLCLAEGKLFLLEEPENDIHPAALKALMELVRESAERNQFIVSTHSHIVARSLGAGPDSMLYYVRGSKQLPPTATIEVVGDDPKARLAVLADLGYELYDFDLWDGWMILEESSAERIVVDYLIPWFAPRLKRVRTVSAGGVSKAGPTFDDFNRLFVFTHLELQYRNRCWVIVDGDEAGNGLVQELRRRYARHWTEDRFRTWTQPDFERYYPARFADRVDAISLLRGQPKQAAKQTLLHEVIAWCDEDPDTAREAFESSAQDVIEVLQEIESTLRPVGAPVAD